MKKIHWAMAALFAFPALLLACPLAQAATKSVDCQDNKDSINEVLAKLPKQGPHTIMISGNCTEAVFIDNFDDLTLAGNPGATISSPGLPEGTFAIWIQHSRNVTVRNLTLNGELDGGIAVATCGLFSVCIFHDVTVQGGSTGILFGRSRGTIGDNSILQDNRIGAQATVNSHIRFGAFPGIGGVTIRNNGNATDGGQGILIEHDSYADLFFSSVQDNVFGNGVSVNSGSFVGVFNSTITENGDAGIALDASSFALLRGASNTITGNAGSGIKLRDLAFLQISGGRTISGNGQPDVNCEKSSARTEGTGGSATPDLGGGTTNCTEPTL